LIVVLVDDCSFVDDLMCVPPRYICWTMCALINLNPLPPKLRWDELRVTVESARLIELHESLDVRSYAGFVSK
jgi:hypothetical protein